LGIVSDAFQRGWDLVKMPMYHGTTEDAWEQIQEEGFLKPYDGPPDLASGSWVGKEKELQELLGMSDEEFEAKYGGDWSFFWGDQATPNMNTVGGKAGARAMGAYWMDNVEDDAVVLEINDKHPDSPYFMPEIPIPNKRLGRSIAWDEQYDQRRTNKPIPLHLIRRLSQKEIEEAQATDQQFSDAESERSRLMDDAYRSQAMSETSDEDFYAHVAMRDKRKEWMRKQRKKYWGRGQ
jgi:hypothetical protein